MKTPALDTPAFTLGEGTVTRTPDGSRAVLRFTAPATRHIDGGFTATVALVLFDAKGRLVARRSSSSETTVIAKRASWEHEVDVDKLAAATSFVYEIDHRVDYRRKITAGEIPELAAEADGSDYWRWLDVDPRTLEDRFVAIDVGLWARNSSLEITYTQHCKVETDTCRTEFELDLLDGQRDVTFFKTFSSYLTCGRPSYDDTSIWMDRKKLRSLKFFELRGRTEVRAIVPLPITV